MRTQTIIATAVLAICAGDARSAVQQPAPAEPAPAVDPQAIDALYRMGAFLQAQTSFVVRTTMDTDYILDDGRKVTAMSRGILRVQRPDRLRADVVGAHKDRQYFYDGRTFTIFAPKVGYYATIAAPPRLGQLADRLEDRYGVELPLVDLFRWGTPEAGTNDITAATYIGPAQVDGTWADHYAFRQQGLDWQIWIQRGPEPLPLRLVLTTTDQAGRPQRSIVMHWELNALHDPTAFRFVPPPNSRQIRLSNRG